MKEIDFKQDLLVKDLVERFRTQSNEVIPGNWKCVGIQIYFVEEETDILSSPGLYSAGFDKEEYDRDD